MIFKKTNIVKLVLHFVEVKAPLYFSNILAIKAVKTPEKADLTMARPLGKNSGQLIVLIIGFPF